MLNKLLAPLRTNNFLSNELSRKIDQLDALNRRMLEYESEIKRYQVNEEHLQKYLDDRDREFVELQNQVSKLNKKRPFEDVFNIKNVFQPVERVPFTKDNAQLATDLLENPLVKELTDQLIKERLQNCIENSADNNQFSLMMTSLLGVKAFKEELERYASYLEEEEEEDETLTHNIT